MTTDEQDAAVREAVEAASGTTPFGVLFLLLQGIPELFRCFYDMGKEREKLFVRILPIYVIVLAVLFLGTFYPKVVPLGTYWIGAAEAMGMTGFDKPTIGQQVATKSQLVAKLIQFAQFLDRMLSFEDLRNGGPQRDPIPH